MVPFFPLTDLAAHEQEFLAWLAVHPRVKHPEIGKFLPFISRHLLDQRPFAVDDFIVTQNQNEVFLKGIDQKESDVSLVITPEYRVERHVFEKVVHPTHVPFEPESEAAEIGRAGNAGPGG